jgi:hypothetical protein
VWRVALPLAAAELALGMVEMSAGLLMGNLCFVLVRTVKSMDPNVGRVVGEDRIGLRYVGQ